MRSSEFQTTLDRRGRAPASACASAHKRANAHSARDSALADVPRTRVRCASARKLLPPIGFSWCEY